MSIFRSRSAAQRSHGAGGVAGAAAVRHCSERSQLRGGLAEALVVLFALFFPESRCAMAFARHGALRGGARIIRESARSELDGEAGDSTLRGVQNQFAGPSGEVLQP
jgi:hypothetical protein